MKTPSRRMPQAKPVKTRPLGWLFLAILAGSLAWAVWQQPLIGLGLALLILLAGLDIRQEKRRLRRLAAERPGESLCSFARGFDCRRVDTWIVRAVYEEITATLAMPQFPLRSEDDLSKTLNLDSDDLELDIAPAIAERTGRPLINTEANPLYNKVGSVADLILFFQNQPIQPPARLAR